MDLIHNAVYLVKYIIKCSFIQFIRGNLHVDTVN